MVEMVEMVGLEDVSMFVPGRPSAKVARKGSGSAWVVSNVLSSAC